MGNVQKPIIVLIHHYHKLLDLIYIWYHKPIRTSYEYLEQDLHTGMEKNLVTRLPSSFLQCLADM
jgi:hypothetical protein